MARDFLAFLGPRADLPLEHIARKDILAFRNAETKRGVSNKTANLAVKIVSMAFNKAVRQAKSNSIRVSDWILWTKIQPSASRSRPRKLRNC